MPRPRIRRTVGLVLMPRLLLPFTHTLHPPSHPGQMLLCNEARRLMSAHGSCIPRLVIHPRLACRVPRGQDSNLHIKYWLYAPSVERLWAYSNHKIRGDGLGQPRYLIRSALSTPSFQTSLFSMKFCFSLTETLFTRTMLRRPLEMDHCSGGSAISFQDGQPGNVT